MWIKRYFILCFGESTHNNNNDHDDDQQQSNEWIDANENVKRTIFVLFFFSAARLFGANDINTR